MIEWSESQLMIRDAVRKFVEDEIAPNLEALEHGDMPPYDILRNMYKTFGMDQMAKANFAKQIEAEKAGEKPRSGNGSDNGAGKAAARADQAAATIIPIIELCRYCPGMVTAMGVSVGLTAGAIQSKGTVEQKERWVPDLLTLEKVGAWAITEPDSGSDAFGGMRSSAKRIGDDFVLNGSKTFITNGPYADTIVFICKLEEEGVDPRDRRILHFVLDRGMDGLEQTPPLRKMGLHSSPTGELFLSDVRCGTDRLLGGEASLKAEAGGRSGAKATFQTERSGVAAMALGIVEQCLQLSVKYAKERVQFGQPIGQYQLIQEKLARMEVARMNLQKPRLPLHRAGVAGQEHELRGGVRHEALLGSGSGRGGDGGRADLRRQRLHVGVSGRAVGARRQGPPDLRRHRRDPDPRHRKRPPRGLAVRRNPLPRVARAAP